MRLLVDSSALAKRYIDDEASEAIDDILGQASELALCVIAVSEIISGLNRRQREGAFPENVYRTIKRQLLDDVRDAVVLQLTPAVIARSIKVLEDNAVRTMDSLHIACALEWRAEIFATADKKQLEAARDSGLQVKYIS